MQKAVPVGGRLALLAIGAGLWLFGLASWEWGGFGEGVNFALRGYYLFVVVDSLVALTVLFGAGGSFRRIIERHQRERNAPLRGVQQPGSSGGNSGGKIKQAWQLFTGVVNLAVAAALAVLGVDVIVEPGGGIFGIPGRAADLRGRLVGVAIVGAVLWWARYELRKLRPVLPPRLVALLDRWNIR